jgi:hypothetical protein
MRHFLMIARRLGILLPAILIASFSCAPGVDQVETQITTQQSKVSASDSSLAHERIRLKAMQDSLEIRIARNIAAGISKVQARAIETTLLKAQKAVVDAEIVNAKTQQEYLALLKKRLAHLESE